ncbi:cupin domain-containing protein [Christiangramia sp. SM2212]|uniref:Cupin domain-containing protein n=1 Tax=Christiangramia sediminicola TaxID=3073267 RepID=A0ABU1ELX3_9FLAO|nr:cupin domain-containing protein [Christiangramia sp. SM2212]MDR5589372.1 cupin domain-containing protein [Christiangramia sp. SM2212]
MWVLGHKVSGHQLSGDYDLATGESAPNVPGPPPHFHENYHESFLIVEGEMDFIINGEVKTIREGESIDIAQGTLHTFKNSGDKVCKWVNVHSPKGFAEFFQQYGIDEEDPEAMQKSVAPEIIQNVLQKAADYDMKIQMEM